MNTQLQNKLERLGQLLTLSPLSQVVKDAILENAEKLTVQDVDKLLAALEREQAELAELARLFVENDAEITREQKEVEREAGKVAQQFTDVFLAKTVADHLKAQKS